MHESTPLSLNNGTDTMRTIASIFLLVLLVTTAAGAQSGGQPRHPLDPNATLVGQFDVRLSASTRGTKSLSTLGDVATYSFTVTIFRSENRIDYVPNIESIAFTSDDAWVDSKTTPQLFEMISKSALSQGLELGYAPCPASCSDLTMISRVIHPSCVKRLGHGIETSFVNCLPGSVAIREYLVCCPNGIEAPVMQQVYVESGSCVVEDELCERTCP